LSSAIARAKEFRRILRQVSNVDVTSRCNLRCEGCFYFEGDDYKQATEEEDLARWRAFLEDQARRGVTLRASSAQSRRWSRIASKSQTHTSPAAQSLPTARSRSGRQSTIRS